MNYGRKGIIQKKKLLNSAATKLGSKAVLTVVKLLFIVIIGVIISGSCLALGSVEGIIASAPDISTIDVSPEGYATKIYNNNGEEIQSLSTAGSNRISVSIDNVPEQLQQAFVAIEDERFYEHNGIDIKGIMRAAYVALSNGDLSQGASTITQQLLKNNVFNAYNETTIEKIKRKVQEQYLAVKLETYMGKQDILENYLNSINLGNGYYGVQAAANGYFGKDVSELSLSECAVIASITKNPTGLNPIRYPEKNQARQHQVLLNMYTQGYIAKDVYDEAVSDDVYARIEGLDVVSESATYSYYVDTLIDQLIQDLEEQKGYSEAQATNLIYKGGLQIYSAQDSTMQAIADEAINDPAYYPSSTEFSISYYIALKDSEGKVSYYSQQNMLNYFQNTVGDSSFSLLQTNQDKAQSYIDQYKEAMTAGGDTIISESQSFTIQPQLSFSLIDQHTGLVKVLVGGRGEKTGNRTLNRATDSKRQPGSSIKPLAAYGPALDTNAITLATALDDAPYYYSGAEAQLVKNYTEGEYRGLLTVREALTISQNVPAVKVLTQITPQVGFNYLEKFGISTLVSPKNSVNGNNDVVQSLALGGMTYGVYNIDMTAAYATIANGGTYTKPIYYTQVLDHDGNIILDNSTAQTHTVLKATTAWLLTNALESVVQSGTATATQLSNQPVAGKTGTTQFDSDKWFCGFTPYYTASIWLGYDDNSKKLNSAIDHRKIWQSIMAQIHSDIPTGDFAQPEGIVQAAVCSKSGKLPVDGLCDSDPRGSSVIIEYFAADNVPTETCDTHVKVTVCNESGMIAALGCTNTSTKIYVKKASKNSLSTESSSYTTWDAPYTITDEQLTNLCSLHSSKTTSKPSTGSSTTTSTTQATTSSTQTTTTGTGGLLH